MNEGQGYMHDISGPCAADERAAIVAWLRAEADMLKRDSEDWNASGKYAAGMICNTLRVRAKSIEAGKHLAPSPPEKADD